MDAKYPTEVAPATAEFVLSVFRDVHRQNFAYRAVDPDELGDLSFDTTVSDSNDAWEHDLLLTTELGRELNAWWKIDCTTAEWRNVLKPASKKPLADVCELIASRAVRQRIRPAKFFGRLCDEAGAFLTIRSLLAEAGADASKITPSTSLEPIRAPLLDDFLGPDRAIGTWCIATRENAMPRAQRDGGFESSRQLATCARLVIRFAPSDDRWRIIIRRVVRGIVDCRPLAAAEQRSVRRPPDIPRSRAYLWSVYNQIPDD